MIIYGEKKVPGRKKNQETIRRRGEGKKGKKKRDRSKKGKTESNAKPKIGERLKGKSADGGDKMEKMNGWAEGRGKLSKE